MGSVAWDALRIAGAQVATALKPFVTVLEHVRVIDGTGAPAKENQMLVLDRAKITYVGPEAERELPADAKVLDAAGKTVYSGVRDRRSTLKKRD